VFRVESKSVVIDAPAGITVKGTVQTSSIANEYAGGDGLSIASIGQALELSADRDISIVSKRGSVSVTAGEAIVMESEEIRLDGRVFLPALVRVDGADISVRGERSGTLCVCGRGTDYPGSLYQADVGATCSVRTDACKQ
jgi:hypothetical protein